jgi:hypothetical protein
MIWDGPFFGNDVDGRLLPASYFSMDADDGLLITETFKMYTSSKGLLFSIYATGCDVIDIRPHLYAALEMRGDAKVWIHVQKSGIPRSHLISEETIEWIMNVKSECIEKVNVQDLQQFRECNIAEFISSVVKREDLSSKVVVQYGKSAFSLKLTVTDQCIPMQNMRIVKGSFASIKGVWLYSNSVALSYRVFITCKQLEWFPATDWARYVVTSILGCSYSLAPISSIDDECFSDYSILESSVKAIETCHEGDGWICDVNAMYRKFEYKCQGKFSINVDPVGVDKYLDAFQFTPYLRDPSSCNDVFHNLMPCGVCPQEQEGRMKRIVSSRNIEIKRFNKGIVMVSALVEGVLGSSITVTKPSYGVRFAKFQSINLLKKILDSAGTVELCPCSYDEPCFKCTDGPEFDSSTYVSWLAGKSHDDWSDQFKLYYVAGKPYVLGEGYGEICSDKRIKKTQLNVKFEDSPSMVLIDGVEHENQIVVRINKFLVELYREFVISDVMGVKGLNSYNSFMYEYMERMRARDTFGSNEIDDPGGFMATQWYKDYSYDRKVEYKKNLMMGVLASVASSAPRSNFFSLWQVVSVFFNDRIVETVTFDFGSARVQFYEMVELFSFCSEFIGLGNKVSQLENLFS